MKKTLSGALSIIKRPAQKINARLIIVLIILAMAILPFIRIALLPANFIFNINAHSSVFTLETPDEPTVTKWRINGAVICSRTRLQTARQGSEQTAGYCGSWNGYRFADPELTLELQGANKITLETKPDGTLYLALRENRAHSVRKLSFTDSNRRPILLGAKVNLVWPAKSMKAGNEPYEHPLFPFMGIATIGRDVNWASRGILNTGKVFVYASDLSSTNKRNLVDQTELMLGDQVRLDSIVLNDEPVFPKGFVRYQPDADHHDLDIVAFGKASQIRIERFGDNGYDFEPSIWSRILKDQFLLTLESTLFASLMLLFPLLPVFEKNTATRIKILKRIKANRKS